MSGCKSGKYINIIYADLFFTVFYLGVISKCQSSWSTDALNTLSDILYNVVHYKGNCALCIYNRMALL